MVDRTPPPVSGTGGGGERSELSIHHTALSDQRNEISAQPEADVARNEPLSAEQRAHQSERLPQPERRSPKWNEAGAKRFAGPFVTLRRSRTQVAARVEQLRGHWGNPRLPGDAGFDLDTIFAEDVSAEMSIRSASAGTSTTLRFAWRLGGCLICSRESLVL